MWLYYGNGLGKAFASNVWGNGNPPIKILKGGVIGPANGQGI